MNKDYFIYGEFFDGKDHIDIIFKIGNNHYRQRKIDEIVEEMNEPSDLTDLFENEHNSVTFTFQYKEEPEESNKEVNIVIVIVAIICLLIFLFFCLFAFLFMK